MAFTTMNNFNYFAKIVVTSVRFAATATQQSSYSPLFSFYHKDLKIVQIDQSQMKPKPTSWDNLKFGLYSDHMMEVDWHMHNGWAPPLISPLHNFNLHPGAKVFHYAIELFEGIKAYRGVDNKIRMFRPDKNMERMRKTAIRASLPDFDGDELMKIISNMIILDNEWVPYSNASSLYIRPTLIGTDPTLGIDFSQQAKLFVLTGPVGNHYLGFRPIALLADPGFVRAFPGGVGGYKMGSNYAPTIMVGKLAKDMSCQQALWLYDSDEKITEAGTMNIFVYWINEQGEEEFVTPPLTDGLILPGITRDSILEIANEWKKFKVTERYPTMAEIKRSLKEKRVDRHLFRRVPTPND
uniref:Branched-chain-amino-acid aminotransferase n=1 Tax=Acrobeloides nanus TaxID=290746 RepID=A0A914C794_9BILA